MQSFGVKRTAGALTGACPHAKFTEEFERELEEAAKFHDSIKDEVRRELEGQGFKCEEEYPVEYTLPQGNKLMGKADLYCTKDEVGIVVEVKSSRIDNGKPRDAIQLYLYYYLLRKANKKVDYAVLIYRDYEDVGSMIDVELGGGIMLRLPRKYVYVRLRVNEGSEQLLRLDEVARELVEGGYVVSRDCEHCVYESCPLVRLQSRGT